MKKSIVKIGKMILAGILICSLTGCKEQKNEQSKDDTIKIGVAIYRGDDTFVSSLHNYLESGLKEEEERIGKKILLSKADAKNSQSNQNDQVDTFINKDYDVICVNMVDRTAAAVIVDKAKEANIPIIFFNREPVEEDMKIWNQTYYVGSNAQEAGIMEGEIITDAFHKNHQIIDKNQDGKLQYVMLEGEQVHQDALIRTEYSIKVLVNNQIPMEKLASGTANWMRSPAYETMISWLNEYGSQIEVVISNNDEMALGAIEALKEYEMLEQGPLVVGIDGTKDMIEAIFKKEAYGTVKNDAKSQAEAILGLACSLSEGQNPNDSVDYLNGHYVRIPHAKITQENCTE